MDLDILYKIFLDSNGISTDTRALKPDQIFFALKGKNFDGNAHAEKAITQGAKLCVIDDPSYQKNTHDYLVVNDVLTTLQHLATHHRLHSKAKIIAITGSNGKTTTKELLAAVLARKYNISFTIGNLNNHIGVPLTLLSIPLDCELAIIEMGANQLNDIKELCEIALPDFGYITNIGEAHLEGFGSIEGVFQAKTALFHSVVKNGTLCFVNQFDTRLHSLEIPSSKVIRLNEDIRITENQENLHLSINYQDTLINTHLTGDYNINNINAAITIGQYFGVPIKDIQSSIAEYVPTNNRSQLVYFGGATIILDAYNANPSSMTASIHNLLKLSAAKKWIIAGDMLELGDYSLEMHCQIVTQLLASDIECIIVVGNEMTKAVHSLSPVDNRLKVFKDTPDCKIWLTQQSISEKVILIKGSRGMKLETLIQTS